MGCFICGNQFATGKTLNNPTRYRVVCNNARCAGLEYQMTPDMVEYWADFKLALKANVGTNQHLNTSATVAEVAKESCVAKPR